MIIKHAVVCGVKFGDGNRPHLSGVTSIRNTDTNARRFGISRIQCFLQCNPMRYTLPFAPLNFEFQIISVN